MHKKNEGQRRSWASVKTYFPILRWLPTYRRGLLRDDLIAGLTVWALLVPEAMAYASLAGVPPEAGLYAAPLAIVGYALFGTSHLLVVGPSSTMSIMSALVIAPIAVGDPERFVPLSAMLALLTGGILLLSGLLRLGVLADFMSKPVLNGFIIGLAMTIAASQLGKLFGYSVAGDTFFETLWYFFGDLDETHLATLAVGVTGLVLLWSLHKFIPKLPAALAVVALSILVSTLLNLEDRQVHIVGEIPAGLPPLGLPSGISLSDLTGLLPGALGIALVAFAESVGTARAYASKYGYDIDANQELMGLGAGNLGAGISQGFVVDGSLSRTAAADQAGARTQTSSLINAGMVLITVVALTPLFRNLPEAILGAIVVHAVGRLIDFSQLKRFYRINRMDFWTATVALLGVLAVGVMPGLVGAVLLSILWLLWHARKPATAILGKMLGQDVYRSVKNYPGSQTHPGLVIFRFDGSLFFASAPTFRDEIRSAVAAEPSVRWVLVDAEAISDIDTTALDILEELRAELARSNVGLRFARMKTDVQAFLRRSGLEDAIGADGFYPSVRAGVAAYLREHREEQRNQDTATEGKD